MKILSRYLLLILLLLANSPLVSAANTTGLPLPRFVSLKSDEVNVRTGPGTRYPIQWVYRRDGFPVEVIEEYDIWRRIRADDGTTGWVHKSMLEGKRNIMIRGKDAQIMRAEPKKEARPILKAEPQVIGKLMECEAEWCRVQVSGQKGWVEKKYLWGVYPNEVFD